MTTNEPTGPVSCPTGETGPSERMISWPAEMPGFKVDGLRIGKWWHVTATRDGDLPIIGIGRTYDDALADVRRHYEHRDGWPLCPARLDPHRGTPAAWRGPVEQHVPSAACKTEGQPTGFVFDPMGLLVFVQDLDRAIERARKIRRETFDAAGRWIAARWLGLLVFVALVGVLAAFHGEWSTRIWVETLQ